MKGWHVVVAVSVLACAWALAQEGGPQVPEREQLVRQLDQLQQQLRTAKEEEAPALMQQIDQLRGRLEQLDRQQQFREIRNAHRNRLRGIDAEIAEIKQHLANAGQDMPQAHRDLVEARLAHLQKLRDLSQQIAGLSGSQELPKAFELTGQIESAEMHWDIVDTPKLEGAARLSEMERAAAELGNPPELLAALQKAKEVREAVMADSEKLFDLWTKHRRMRREFDEALDGFWRMVEQAHAARQEQP